MGNVKLFLLLNSSKHIKQKHTHTKANKMLSLPSVAGRYISSSRDILRPLLHSTKHLSLSSLKLYLNKQIAVLLLKFGTELSWPYFTGRMIVRADLGWITLAWDRKSNKPVLSADVWRFPIPNPAPVFFSKSEINTLFPRKQDPIRKWALEWFFTMLVI